MNVDWNDQVWVLGQFRQMVSLDFKVIDLEFCQLDHAFNLLRVLFGSVGAEVALDAGEDEGLPGLGRHGFSDFEELPVEA